MITQDIDHLTKVVTDQNIQIANLKRKFYEEPEPEPEPVSEQLERNAEALEKFIKATSDRKPPDVFLALRRMKESNTRRKIQRYKGYGSYKQQKTPVCPCGKHMGIEFLNDGTHIDHLCPKHWWVIQTWVALDDKKIGAFVDSTPLAWYLGNYKLEAE